MAVIHLLRTPPYSRGRARRRSPAPDKRPTTRCGLALVGGMLAVEQPRQADGLGLELCPSCLARSLEV